MQPPPRKVKVTQELRNIQGEQMTKLQAKHQAECDLLEDMRTFSQKKAAIEREYAQVSVGIAISVLGMPFLGLRSCLLSKRILESSLAACPFLTI